MKKPRRATTPEIPTENIRSLIVDLVRRIPPGRVATYGQVAAQAGIRGHARQVGYALHGLPDDTDVPWHRVVNAQGEISIRSSGCGREEQRRRLEREGVTFDAAERIDLERFRWGTRSAPWE